MLELSCLASLLEVGGVITSDWGRGEAKSIKDLFQEIKDGESVLRVEATMGGVRLVRVLRVVKMSITQTRTLKTLREVKQILPDGRVRERNQLPGGKIVFDESPADALCREMEEELTLEPGEYTWSLPEAPVFEERFSPSYPHLLTIYERYTFSVNLSPNIEYGRFRDGFHHKEASGIEAVFAWVQ
jgi:8-oxo-dGTP pyrophosphatase MutT (NUDIX family)